jgi:hypothetical protein
MNRWIQMEIRLVLNLRGGCGDDRADPDSERPALGPFMLPLLEKVQFRTIPFPYSLHPLSSIGNSEPTT